MRDGVTMRDPSTVYLDWDVELAADVTLEPNVILRGATSVGEGSVIGAGTQLVDATIGRDVRVWASVDRAVERRGRRHASGRSATSGRAASSGAGAEVGNFAELKNTRLGAGVEAAPHELPRRRRRRRAGQHRGGHDHRELRRHAQAPHDDRRRRVHRRRHDARRAGRRSARAPGPGAGAVVTRDVPAGKLAVGVPARIREPRARTETATDRGSARLEGLMDTDPRAPRHRRPDAPRRRLRRRRDRPRHVRRTRIEQLVDEGNRGARRVQRLIDQPGRFLAVTQIGLTFLGFLASAYAAVSLTDEPRGAARGVGHRILGTSAGGARRSSSSRSLLSLFTIVFGELVPKSLALAHAERVRALA